MEVQKMKKFLLIAALAVTIVNSNKPIDWYRVEFTNGDYILKRSKQEFLKTLTQKLYAHAYKIDKFGENQETLVLKNYVGPNNLTTRLHKNLKTAVKQVIKAIKLEEKAKKKLTK